MRACVCVCTRACEISLFAVNIIVQNEVNGSFIIEIHLDIMPGIIQIKIELRVRMIPGFLAYS